MVDELKPRQSEEPDNFDVSTDATLGDPVKQLLIVLETDYVVLLTRLSARLGSRETAAEILHDVYVKLRSEPAIGELRNPRAYLYRMSVNFAKNKHRSDWRSVNMNDAALNEIPDDEPDQEAATLAMDEMSRALQALHALPIRQQAIFLAKWRDEKLQSEIAAEFGLHRRSVQKELTRTELYLRKILRRPKRPDRR